MSDELSNTIVNEKNKHQAPVTHENLHLSKTKYNFKNLFYQGPAKEKTYCGVAFSLTKKPLNQWLTYSTILVAARP